MKKNTQKTRGSYGNGSLDPESKPALPKSGKQDANLPKNSSTNFQMGLIIALLLVFIAFEISFSSRLMTPTDPPDLVELPAEYYPELEALNLEKPIIKQNNPIQKRTDPEEFKVIADDEPLNHTHEFIQKIDEHNPPSLDVSSMKVIEKDPEVEVMFILVEDAPIFPGCEGVTKEERKACFEEKMQQHIKKNVRYPEAEQAMGIEGRVFLTFKIDVDGSIFDVQLHGPTQGLEDEAKRIIGKLPVMTPGKQAGKPVRVPFSIPIHFQLQK